MKNIHFLSGTFGTDFTERPIGDEDVARRPAAFGAGQIGAQRREQIADDLGCSHRAGGFDDQQIARLQHRRDRAHGGQDIADVGVVIGAGRRGHGDDESVRRGRRGLGGQAAGADLRVSLTGRTPPFPRSVNYI